MAQLSIRNLEKVYGGALKALHGINLDVKDGEFMVLVGPSGCAKSTTLRMIAGLETVSGGHISIGDKVVNNLPPGERGIAMVFQNYALYPHMKVRKNLSFGLKLAGEKKDEIARRVAEVADVLEIGPLLDRLPKQLSGGQAQRVALGRALIKKPEVFLFDEPLSNLDAKLRASMRVRITDLHRRLKEQGQSSTVVYVTHDQVEAMTMGDRICVMKDGRIMQVADPETLYARPENAFVAGFIGMPEMNLVNATVSRGEGGPVVTFGDQSVRFGADLAGRLAAGTDGDVTFGVRPQHFRLAAPGEDALIAKVIKADFLGHEVDVHVTIGGERFTVVLPVEEYRKASVDGALRIRPDEERVFIFDRVSGQNISLA
ncbi:sn-glycerol-3-phosphate ABC transporter ATP-binding protein UgpC [Neorhizobium sp. JUb45]|uniref:ABC transporter ATP-binding protein n=1 Tax=unclassified Neorhizobium TaxID=2629175 RepID=UPI00104FD77F|nr:sn-glycerol-3-phosphate ABC transporter ATP-binding protein UgpC [Neorhizobium sp. JUb45]TCR02980.1 oligogalacturonide transport system ATP-binding protein [Neorhizobium sp. JUb45]